MRDFKIILIIIGMISFISCETTQDPSEAPLEFTESPEAQGSFDRLTRGGRTIPSAASLNLEINGANGLTERLHTPPCETCGVAGGETRSGDAIVSGTPGNYTHNDRAGLVDQIISNGPDAFGTTEITMNGQCYEVMNDSPTLPDGTYVPFTFEEVERMVGSSQWGGWQVPNLSQAQGIRRYAEEQGSVLDSITRTNNTNTLLERNIGDIMSGRPERIQQYAQRGRTELINGHFKWYVRHENQYQIFGFRRNGTSRYWQNGPSDHHSSQPDYVDYSHGVRLIRSCR